jgi:hypothetical protein
MVQYCGKPAYKLGITRGFIPALYPQLAIRFVGHVHNSRLYARRRTSFTRSCAYFFVKFQSVNRQLSPVYTAPIIKITKG